MPDYSYQEARHEAIGREVREMFGQAQAAVDAKTAEKTAAALVIWRARPVISWKAVGTASLIWVTAVAVTAFTLWVFSLTEDTDAQILNLVVAIPGSCAVVAAIWIPIAGAWKGGAYLYRLARSEWRRRTGSVPK